MSWDQIAVLAQTSDEGGGIAGAISGLVFLGVFLVVIAGVWKTFVKAGEPGWASIIPIYNIIVTLKIAGKPLWWILLCLIPFVNIIVFILVFIDFAKNFGKGAGFGLGLAFLGFIFFPILGFGDAKYIGNKS
jgi:hypothetical protein